MSDHEPGSVGTSPRKAASVGGTLTVVVADVTALLGVGGSYLLGIAPPEARTLTLASGAFVFATVLGLLIHALYRHFGKIAHRRYWFLLAGCAFLGIVVGFDNYQQSINRLTFELPPADPNASVYVKGSDLQPTAEAFRRANPQKSDAEMVLDFGGIAHIDRVWTPESIASASRQLTLFYLLLVSSVVLTCLSLLHLALLR